MKKNIFKKVGLLGVTLAASLSLNAIVNAEDNCTTYTNYYYFSEINSQNYYTTNTASSDLTHHTVTFIPALPSGAEIVDEGKVCLANDTSDTCFESNYSLDNFVTNLAGVFMTGDEVSYNTPEGTSTYRIMTSQSSNTSYIVHGVWYMNQNGTIVNRGSGFVDFVHLNNRNIDTDLVVGGSIIPSTTTINRLTPANNSDSYQIEVRRTIKKADVDAKTPYKSDFDDNTMIAPALYKIVYKANCQNNTPDDPTQTDETKYTLKINYLYEDDRTEVTSAHEETQSKGYNYSVTSPTAKDTSTHKNCTPSPKVVSGTLNRDYETTVLYRCTGDTPTTTYTARIYYVIEKDGVRTPASERDSSVKNFEKSGLKAGESGKKESPEIKNCKVKSSGDKTVTYKIDKNNPEDYEYTVVYLCDEDQPTAFEQTMNNPKTGATMMISAWAIALGAIGYSVYYFRNARKEETAEI